ncbi:hypothetical protein Ndes2437B_g08758 [Nannochloris sp. 'desiccata']
MARSPERRSRSRSRSRERDSKRRRSDHYGREEDGGRDYRTSRDKDRDRGQDRSRGGYRDDTRGRDDRYYDRRNDGADRRRDDDDYQRDDYHSPRRQQLEEARPQRDDYSNGGVPPTGDNGGQAPAQPRGEPLSLEELLRKKQAEKAEQSKPVFLSKQQQAAGRGAAVQASGGGGGGNRSSRPSGSGRDRDYDYERNRDYSRGDGGRNGGSRADRDRERELELIKQSYLGKEKEKKKIVKTADRFKFNFDWDAKDDTSRDLNPLYQDTHEAALLFGRGFRAGIDRREQKKASAEAETETLRRARSAAGGKETGEDRQRAAARANRANKYDDRGDMRIETHWSEKPRERMTERDWRIFREDFNISYKGTIPQEAFPIRNWEESNLPDAVRRAIQRVGYKTPSPIQMASIPLGMQQRDVIGVAETGSGKTAAFVLPMLAYIMKQPPMTGNPDIEAEGPYAVILAPTRELAQQIEEETIKLAHYTGFRVVSVVGGQNIEDQGFALRKGCEIVVATPGRLVDCVERQYAVLNQCNYVVLDEADRMIDMGFEPQVMGVLDAMPSSNLKPENEDEPLEAARVYRTTYMFSATMPPAVERLARKYLRRPVVVNIGAAGKATANVSQRVLVVKENEKPKTLEQQLNIAGNGARIIVFANTQKKCEHVVRLVENLGYAAAMLHGGKSQDQREESIKGFRDDKYNILVATDVAGRGIDVPNVALVINYDMPLTIEAYTHRIGRTGRAGKKGDALTFLTMGDTDVFFDLKKFLEESKAPVPRELANHEASRQKPGTRGSQFIRD